MDRLSDTSTTFGFDTVAVDDRQSRVNGVFASVARRYDLMNDLMSGGLHRAWKSDLAAQVNPPRTAQRFDHLDVAGGTADVALRVARRGGTGTRSTVCDISPEMLSVGAQRIADAGERARISTVEGNAEALDFADAAFDAYTIAFGIRNVTHIDEALSEAHRVLKYGGHFLCLEFSEVTIPGFDRLYDFHSFNVIPRLGELTTGDRESYEYLVESIRRFPDQETFADMIRDAGFDQVTYRNLTGGIAAIHSGWKL